MKKKILIIAIITIIIILLAAIPLVINYKEQNKVKERNNITTTTKSFTITDEGTEIEVNVKNKNNKEIKIKNIQTFLYDTSNKKIATLEYKKETKISKEKIIKITSKEKYPNTSNIKYKIYN